MSGFDELRAAYPKDKPYAPANMDELAGYRDRVPADVITEWETYGFGSYGKGLFWTVDPRLGQYDPNDWYCLEPEGVVLLRNSFADFGVWQSGRLRWVSVVGGDYFDFGADFSAILRRLARPEFRSGALQDRLRRLGTKRFGPVGEHDCFGFDPRPSTGDVVTKEDIQRYELKPYVALCGREFSQWKKLV